jgi:hypothetical protein
VRVRHLKVEDSAATATLYTRAFHVHRSRGRGVRAACRDFF